MEKCHIVWANESLPCTHGWEYELGPRENNLISEVSRCTVKLIDKTSYSCELKVLDGQLVF